jgi:hypothetical protein
LRNAALELKTALLFLIIYTQSKGETPFGQCKTAIMKVVPVYNDKPANQKINQLLLLLKFRCSLLIKTIIFPDHLKIFTF